MLSRRSQADPKDFKQHSSGLTRSLPISARAMKVFDNL